jgi:hypothetical protein
MRNITIGVDLATSNRLRGVLAEFGGVLAWEKATPEQCWIQDLERRLPFGKVRVALANKHARQLGAMRARGEHYDAGAWLKHPMAQRPASRRSASE